MKKAYSKPVVEKIDFDYKDQIVASGMSFNGKNHGHDCGDPRDVSHWDNPGNNPKKFP